MTAASEAENASEQVDEPSVGLKDQLVAAVSSTRRATGDLVELFGLEARLAGISAAKLLGMGLAAGFMVMSAYLLLQAALAVWLYQLGLNLGLALLLFAIINGGLTLVLLLWAARNSRNLLFTATRRALKSEAGDEPTNPGYRPEGNAGTPE